MSHQSNSTSESAASTPTSPTPDSDSESVWELGRVVSYTEQQTSGSQHPEDNHELVLVCSHCTDGLTGPTFVVPDKKLAPNGFYTDLRCPCCNNHFSI